MPKATSWAEAMPNSELSSFVFHSFLLTAKIGGGT